METVTSVCQFLEAFAPLALAEEWDNVGLLVGRQEQPVRRLMTCLTLTPSSVEEAVEENVDLVVAHHPLPFRPVQRITDASTTGRMLLDLAAASVAVYSPHTAFDSAANGINQQLAEALGLARIVPLVPADAGSEELDAGAGGGRIGEWKRPRSVAEAAEQLTEALGIDALRAAGPGETRITRVAVGCGSAGTFLDAAVREACQLFVTGETSFHTCLAAEAHGITLFLTGHYASERFAVERLAERLAAEFTSVEVWASRREEDPLRTLRS